MKFYYSLIYLITVISIISLNCPPETGSTTNDILTSVVCMDDTGTEASGATNCIDPLDVVDATHNFYKSVIIEEYTSQNSLWGDYINIILHTHFIADATPLGPLWAYFMIFIDAANIPDGSTTTFSYDFEPGMTLTFPAGFSPEMVIKGLSSGNPFVTDGNVNNYYLKMIYIESNFEIGPTQNRIYDYWTSTDPTYITTFRNSVSTIFNTLDRLYDASYHSSIDLLPNYAFYYGQNITPEGWYNPPKTYNSYYFRIPKAVVTRIEQLSVLAIFAPPTWVTGGPGYGIAKALPPVAATGTGQFNVDTVWTVNY